MFYCRHPTRKKNNMCTLHTLWEVMQLHLSRIVVTLTSASSQAASSLQYPLPSSQVVLSLHYPLPPPKLYHRRITLPRRKLHRRCITPLPSQTALHRLSLFVWKFGQTPLLFTSACGDPILCRHSVEKKRRKNSDLHQQIQIVKQNIFRYRWA